MKLVSIPRTEFSATVWEVKVMQAVSFFKSIDRAAVFWINLSILLRCIYNITSSFGAIILNMSQILHDETNVEQWSNVKVSENTAELCSRGLTNLRPVETWINYPEFLSIYEGHMLASDLSGQPEPVLEVKGGLMTVVAAINMSCQSKLNKHPLWTRLLRALV